MKKLEIGNFYVKDIVFGVETVFEDGVLTVNKDEAVQVINPDGKLKNIELYVVHPGDSVRICPVKGAVEPRFRPDGRALFPGYTGPVSACGEGQLYAMKGIAVLASGRYSSMGDGILDMSGPGAEYCYFAATTNLVINAERTNEKELDYTLREEDEFRISAHYMAEYLGKALEGKQPEEWEIYDLDAGEKQTGEKTPDAKKLPRVGYVMTVISQLAKGINDLFLGQDCNNMMPLLVHPQEILDGFLLGGMGLAGQAITTYDCQNLPMIKRLYQEHGKTIDFAGVILSPADVSDSMKLRNAISTAQIAEQLRLDGAFVNEWGGGSNVDVDTFYLIRYLEDKGIKTVGIMDEHIGKVYTDPKADAIVSVGETSPIIELPPMDQVIGDDRSLVRNYYYGAWSTHTTLGPSLRPDHSVIVNTYALACGGNPSSWLKRAVKEY